MSFLLQSGIQRRDALPGFPKRLMASPGCARELRSLHFKIPTHGFLTIFSSRLIPGLKAFSFSNALFAFLWAICLIFSYPRRMTLLYADGQINASLALNLL